MTATTRATTTSTLIIIAVRSIFQSNYLLFNVGKVEANLQDVNLRLNTLLCPLINKEPLIAYIIYSFTKST